MPPVPAKCDGAALVIRPDNDPTLRRTSTTWSALKGERLISLTPGNLVQQFIDKHLARIGVVLHPCALFNYLDTQIAMVEAGEGVAIIPSFVLPACRNRRVVLSRLINPVVVNLDSCWISNRGKKLPPGADDFTSFLKSYIADGPDGPAFYRVVAQLRRLSIRDAPENHRLE
jgi:LysR family transcriptional regulator, carnitine catabolism transcriptional activator